MTDVVELKHYINGKFVTGQSDKRFDIYNPASAKVIKCIQGANASDVSHAISIAHDAGIKWALVPPAKRAQVFYNFRQLLIDNSDELVHLISLEHGKTLSDAHGELMRGLEVVEYCCAINAHLKSDFTAEVSNGIDSFNMRQPLGVCAGITPFNFPAMVPLWMFPVAIACGNSFILKPSEKTPSCALRLSQLMTEAGLPDGVLNTVVGDKEAVDEILQNPKVQAVSFVGSTAVGEYVYQYGSQHNKRVQALCGAKNHMLVMPDADVQQAVDAALGAAYGSAGERCMAVSVVVTIDDATADTLIEKLATKVKALRIGAFDDKAVDMGPLVSAQSYDKVRSYIDSGVEQGAALVVDGRDFAMSSGYFIGGSLFDHVTQDMRIYQEEIFGPVLSVVRAQDYAQALELINTHEYGNGAAIFTRDGDAARHFTMQVKAGMVGVNVPIPVPVAMHSFGGWKRSLFGSASIHGMEGVRFYTNLKTVTSRWPSGIRDGAQFHFQSGKDV